MEVNTIFLGDCLDVMQKKIRDDTIDCIITSPPYNLLKEYEKKLTKDEYLDWMKRVLQECYRVLKVSGRLCFNIPNNMSVARSREIWSPTLELGRILYDMGYKFFDIIIWDQLYSDSATAWGSWLSASAPFIRHRAEAVLIFYKDVWKKQHRGVSDITKEEFMSWTNNEVWQIPPQTANRDIHQAPFPEELPRRLIKLFTFKNDIILDPFLGSGTTTKVAKELGRRYVGIELNEKYYEYALKRTNNTLVETQLSENYIINRKIAE